MILLPGERLYILTSGTGYRTLLRPSVIREEESAKLYSLTCSHCFKLFGRLFYTYEDVFGSEYVFTKESTSLIIRPGILCYPKETDKDV